MEGSFDWDTNTAKAYTNDTITVNAITDLAAAPAFTVSDPTVLSATPNTTGSAWTISGKSAGTATITIDTTNVQSSINTLTVTVADGHYLNQRGLARVWNKIKTLLSGFVTADDGVTTEPVTATVSTAMIQDGAVTPAKTSFSGYDTDETAVGMFNNSTLYRRSYAVAAGPQPGVDAQISIASDIAMAVKVEGYLSNGDIVFPLPSPRITLANTIAAYVDIINKRIVLEAGSDRSGYSGYVTLYYIKS